MAVRLYLAVAKDHPGTRAAQNALLMAGQVTLSQLSDSRRARTLFRRYLKTYPKGIFRKDVDRLLRVLEPRRK